MIYKAFASILDSVCGVVYKKGDIMPKNYLLIYSEQLATMLPSSANYVCNLHSAADAIDTMCSNRYYARLARYKSCCPHQKILQKRVRFLQYFFIHCESNGISSRFSVYIIAAGAYHQP